MEPPAKRPIGRPLQGEDAKRSPLSLKVTSALRSALESAATRNGKSLTQEIEERLTRSLAADDGVGGPENARLFRLLRMASDRVEQLIGRHWSASPTSIHIFREAMLALLYRLGSDVTLQELEDLLAEPDEAARSVLRENYSILLTKLGTLGGDIARYSIEDLEPDLVSSHRKRLPE